MPLIIVTGLPCSGKTHRASQIAEAFKTRISSDPSTGSRRTVLHLPSNHARLDTEPSTSLASTEKSANPREILEFSADLRESIYTFAAAEKTARAEEFSAIKRALHRDVVVIADSLNYIKGYRYQLWCEAKAAGTRCCVVHIAAQQDEVEQWNRKRLRASGMDEDQVDGGNDLATPGGATDEKGLVGKDVKGTLVPESHTTIYGDNVAAGAKMSRSRSSSMDGLSEDEPRQPPDDDGLTLKSLYLRDSGPISTGQQHQGTLQPVPARPEAKDTPTSSPVLPPVPSSASPYTPSTLTSLIMRYEPPSPFSRWDTPLFTIPTSDPHPPYSKIWDACFPPPRKLTSKKALSQFQGQNPHKAGETDEEVKRHAATILPTATSAEALQTLESATADVVTVVFAKAKEMGIVGNDQGGTISFGIPNKEHETDPRQNHFEVQIPMGVVVSQPMLQRLRRKYTQIQRGGIAHGQGHVRGRSNVIDGFVRFLDDELQG